MTPPTRSEAERIAAGLSHRDRLALTSDWDAFCDCDWNDMSVPAEGFADRLEERGFIYLDDVDEDDLDDPFAYERGIEPGRLIYRLTPLGLAIRAVLPEAQ